MAEGEKSFVIIDNFSGGLAESDILGVKGSFVDAAGINIHSKPGLITPNQQLTKDSAAIVTDFMQFGFYGTDGNVYGFGDSGKIYKRTGTLTPTNGTWTNPRTEATAILGAAEWNGFFYWATATSLNTMIKTGNWTTDVNNFAGWPKTLTTAVWHPMTTTGGLFLCIGNAQQIATVDNTGGPGAFVANGTGSVTLNNIPPTLEITSMTTYGIDIIIGTRTVINSTTNGDSNAEIRRWDLVTPNFTQIIPISEPIVNVFLKFENNLYAQCGTSGSLYYYDGASVQKYKKIIGNYDNNTMTCNPGATTVFRGLPLFGVSNNSGNAAKEGVYSLGRYDKNYPIALNLEYVVSGGATGRLTNIQVGCLIAFANVLFVSWKDTTGAAAYGVDLIDWTLKYTAAYWKSTAIQGDRHVDKYWTDFAIAYFSLPASTSLALAYFANNGSKTAITVGTQTKQTNTYYAQGNIEAGVMEFQIDFTVSGNNAPSVESFRVDWRDDNF